MASILFAGQSVGLIVLPLMLFHQIQLMVCATLARRWAARDAGAHWLGQHCCGNQAPRFPEFAMGYTLITANRNYSSWSWRPWLLMRARAIPFADRVEPFVARDGYDVFRRFSPTGQVPVLLDGPRTAWDSLGITLYLAERNAGIWPADDAARPGRSWWWPRCMAASRPCAPAAR